MRASESKRFKDHLLTFRVKARKARGQFAIFDESSQFFEIEVAVAIQLLWCQIPGVDLGLFRRILPHHLPALVRLETGGASADAACKTLYP